MAFVLSLSRMSPGSPDSGRPDKRTRLGAIALCLFTTAALAAERPNVVLIMSDDMGYSDIGCYGGEIDTPNLDALAANGLRFTQFYNAGRCCPTRASLLTGLYPHQAGMGHMAGIKRDAAGVPLPAYTGGLNLPCWTIAEVLGRAGYRTYMSGKWHVTRHIGAEGPKHNWPRQRGFGRFYGTIIGAGSFYDPTTLCRENTYITPMNDADYRPWGDRPFESGDFYYTNAITDNAVAFLDDHDTNHTDEPFFLYVAHTAAHWPMHALEEDIAAYRGKYDAGYDAIRRARYERMQRLGVLPAGCELSDTVGDWAGVEHREWELRCMEVYAAMVHRMDRGIGRIVDTLREQGRLDNTLILFLQDNGGCAEGNGRKTRDDGEPTGPKPDDELQPRITPPMWVRSTGERYRSGPQVMPGPEGTYIAYGRNWANVSNTPFRWYKHYTHEGGISTPLVAHWPKGIAARGETRDQPSHLIDVMATCVDLAAAEYPAERDGEAVTPLEGVSLRPAFADEPLGRDTIFWEHEGQCAIRTGDWKLVRLRNEPWELYDLTSDRAELHDLIDAQPDRAARMAAAWQAWAERAQVLPSPFIE